MFVLTFKIQWWRVVSFFMSAIIIAAGIYFLMKDRTDVKKTPDVPPSKQEGQVWQV